MIIMQSKRTYPNCNHKIPSDTCLCLICGYGYNNQQRPSREEDFPIWEGELSRDNIHNHGKSSRYPHEKTHKIPNRSVHSKRGEVCKCLGKVDGTDCNTYYSVSSIKRHGGCARRDCSNSFENSPRIVIGQGKKVRIEYEESDVTINIFLGIMGLFILLIGVAAGSGIFILGIIVIGVAVSIPHTRKTQRYENVNFRLVNRSQVPKNAKDPWTQKKIIETARIKKSRYLR